MALLSGRNKKEFQDLITTDNFFYIFISAHSGVDETTRKFVVPPNSVICHTGEVGMPTYKIYAQYYKSLFYKKQRNLTTNVLFGEYGPKAEGLEAGTPDNDKYKYFTSFFPGEEALDKVMYYDDNDVKERESQLSHMGIYVYDPKSGKKAQFDEESDAIMRNRPIPITHLAGYLEGKYSGRICIFFFMSCSSTEKYDEHIKPPPLVLEELARIHSNPFFSLAKNAGVPKLPDSAAEQQIIPPFSLKLINTDDEKQIVEIPKVYIFEEGEKLYRKLFDKIKQPYFIIYFTRSDIYKTKTQINIYLSPLHRLIDYDLPNIHTSYTFLFKIFKTQKENDDYLLKPGNFFDILGVTFDEIYNGPNPFNVNAYTESTMPIEKAEVANVRLLAHKEGIKNKFEHPPEKFMIVRKGILLYENNFPQTFNHSLISPEIKFDGSEMVTLFYRGNLGALGHFNIPIQPFSQHYKTFLTNPPAVAEIPVTQSGYGYPKKSRKQKRKQLKKKVSKTKSKTKK